MCDEMFKICKNVYVCSVFYELPFIQAQGSGKAAISAAKQDVIKLTMLAGMLAVTLPNTSPVRVIDWKGQLDKKKVCNRVSRAIIPYVPKTATTHEIDAIGIGLYVIKKGLYEIQH